MSIKKKSSEKFTGKDIRMSSTKQKRKSSSVEISSFEQYKKIFYPNEHAESEDKQPTTEPTGFGAKLARRLLTEHAPILSR